jgi:predicted ATPase/class 3 adenylate cyclase/DNA-binding SARP family transcriptional activator
MTASNRIPTPGASPPFTLRLFGPFEALVGDDPLPALHSRKGQWLLALLVLRGPNLDRSWLAGTLWPESSETVGLKNLRNCLNDLRRALGPQASRLRSPTPRSLSLDLEDAAVDLSAFDEAVAQGEEAALARAIGLYRGPLLEGCVEAWVLPEREAREQATLGALETLAAAALKSGEPGTAERYLRQAVAADPLRESAQRGLMRALAAGGSEAAALLAYRELRLRLHRELNAEPDPETEALFQQIRAEARSKAEGIRRPGSLPSSSPPHQGAHPATGPRGGRTSSSPHLLPEGTITFLFTDIEGSTRLWEEHPKAMSAALARHDALLRQVIAAHGGEVFKTVGDAVYGAFGSAPAAVAAALEAQRTLIQGAWDRRSGAGQGDGRGLAKGEPPASSPSDPQLPASAPFLRVRIALHAGVAEEREADYFGPALNRVARILKAGHGGQVLLSLATEQLAGDHLPDGASLRDLGEHRLKDLARPERIFQLLHPDLPADFPPLRSLAAFAHNLPVPLTSFVGREEQIAEVERLLPTTHLLTLTGAGGCGKTRLALQVAADLVEQYADGVWLVELAALSDPGLVRQTVASALGVREESGRPLAATLTDYLRSRSLLLVLDNCEHLLSACAGLAEELLRGCPGLRILATSREGLGIAGERTYRVPSLSLPDLARLPLEEKERVAVVTQSEAVRLFTERAGFSQPGFRVEGENAAAVAQVCRQLDGIPLAIELAAARVKAMPVETIAERLDDRFRLLTGGSRTALPRQQTLRALIDWSYNLLAEPERVLLRRLSVFASGWTLEAAEAVCSNAECGMRNAELGEDAPSSIPHSAFCILHSDEVLDLLTQLVDKSLVLYEEQSREARYRMLETVRQYGRDRLLESGEAEVVRGRHRDWCLALAEQAEAGLWSAEQAGWLERLEVEHDNLRAALEWCQADPGGAEAGLRMAGAVWRFWSVRGYLAEGRSRLATALAQVAPEPPSREYQAARAKALDGAGFLEMNLGDYDSARSLYEESLAIGRELGDRRVIATALNSLGDAMRFLDDPRSARTSYEDALAMGRELDDKPSLAYSLTALGIMAAWHGGGDYKVARALFEEGLVIKRQLNDKRGIAYSLDQMGKLARSQGDDPAARSLFEEGLTIWRELGDRRGIAGALDNLGRLACAQSDLEAARSLHEESLAIRRGLGNQRELLWTLLNLVEVAHVQGDEEAERTLLQESLPIHRALGDTNGVAECLDRLARLAATRG